MSAPNDSSSADPQAREDATMAEIVQLPLGGRLKAYTKRSGPGWLQGAITLGGGSLAGALYLGVMVGNSMMWLQPLAMILGVIMLSAIAYVTLSTGQRPFGAIKEHVSPVLAWAWILATLAANIVWCMPQFGLGQAAVQQNLLPSLSSDGAGIGICAALFVVALTINFFYESGNKGIKLFEAILKIMVGIVVISFFGVVISMTVNGALDWGSILSGLVPDFSMLTKPAKTFGDAIAATGEYAAFWEKKIIADQRDIMMTAFGTAVGINMTFLLPYSMLKKGWGKNHRGLAIFDLSIGLIVPFVLATSCVVIAAASQFHASSADVLDEQGQPVPAMVGGFNGMADTRIKAELGAAAFAALSAEEREEEKGLSDAALKSKLGEIAFGALSEEEQASKRDALPKADRELAAMLVKRDNFNLAAALTPLTGPKVAQIVFGVGVLGMALSTIIILMLINGFTLCEMFNRPGSRALHMLGATISGVGGFAGLFYLWSDSKAKAALAVPTSVAGGAMIPIAYFTFLLLMNSKSLLGDAKPTGAKALRWNLLMGLATAIATGGSIWVLMGKGTAGMTGIAVLAALFVLGLLGFLSKSKKHA